MCRPSPTSRCTWAIWTPHRPLPGRLERRARRKLRLFLNYLDRTITDSFCHANLGWRPPGQGRLLEVLLRGEHRPNFTLKYDPVTPTPLQRRHPLFLACSNPALCSHPANRDTFDDYGVSSCYNILPIRGGAYTSPGSPSPAWWTTPGVEHLWRSCSRSACA